MGRRRRTLHTGDALPAATFAAGATHQEVQDAICKALTYHKIPHSVTDATRTLNKRGRQGRPRVSPGWPDISACLPFGIHDASTGDYLMIGRFWAIEVKVGADELRLAQRDTLLQLARGGALVTIARSVEDVLKVLEA